MVRKKKRIVVANWKMNPSTLVAARTLFRLVVRNVAHIHNSRVIICPPTLYLSNLIGGYGGTTILFGAQDVSTETSEGSFTGDISSKMLKRLGVEYVIVGHSERRAQGETNDIIAQKTLAALKGGLKPILCVGEHKRDEEGKYLKWLEEEINSSLKGVSRQRVNKLMIAYEPLWAIGKKAADAASPRDIHEMSLFIRKVLVKQYGRKTASTIKILYGGSVEPENDDELIAEGLIDGFLVGHASLDADMFREVVRNN